MKMSYSLLTLTKQKNSIQDLSPVLYISRQWFLSLIFNIRFSKMVKLTEDMVIARSKGAELHNIKKLNCW